MEVTILGTGSLYERQTCASVLIDQKVLFDVGPGVVKMLYQLGYSIENICMIILTHMHYDHYLDLLLLFAQLEIDKTLEPFYLIGPVGMKEKITMLCQLTTGSFYDVFLREKVIFIELDDTSSEIKEISGYTIEVIKVEHGKIPAYGFIINKKLGISGDTTLCSGIEKIVSCCSKVIIDTSVIETTKEHLGVFSLKEMLSRYPNVEFYATHLRASTRDYLLNEPISRLHIVEDGYCFHINKER